MLVLGIETSCDETATAVVKNGREVFSNIVSSSLSEHMKYYGVIPEIASRAHVESINFVVKKALKTAKIALNNVNLIAVTDHPGLVGSLLVGTSFAQGLSFALKKPLVEVDHVYAHLYSAFLEGNIPKIPCIGLVASGGHSNLYYVRSINDFILLGKTQDDACGEAFDKVAKILELGYPGGPMIDRISRNGDPQKLKFKCADLPDNFDFSFSGIKTAVLYYVKNKWDKQNVKVADIASSFQEEVIDILVKKSIEACKTKRVESLVIGGGVAANSRLRFKLTEATKKNGIKVHLPSLSLCLDNAAMVAGLGYRIYTGR